MNSIFEFLGTCLRTMLLAILVAVGFFYLTTYASKALSAPSVTLEVTPDWIQAAATPTFVLQNTCGDDLYLRSSPSEPPAGDITGSFLIGVRDIWTQSISTSDLWWIRSKSKTCNVTIQEF